MKFHRNSSNGLPPSPPLGLTVEIPAADLSEPLSPVASSAESSTFPFSASTPLPEDHRKSRDERLCKLFDIEQEVFKDYFRCAYMTKNTPWFVVQGLLYVFEEHVCFYSSLFGIETCKVIPLQHVESVQKATTLGIPNSLKITYKDGRDDFFTSFLSRKPAYALITEALQKILSGPKSLEPRKTEISMFGRKVRRHNVFPRTNVSNSMHRVRSTDNVRPSSRPSSPGILEEGSDDPTASLSTSAPDAAPMPRLQRATTVHKRSRSGHRRNNSRGSRGHQKEWEDDLALQGLVDQQINNGSPPGEASSGEEVVYETPFQSPAVQLNCLSKQLSAEPPPIPDGWTLLVEGVVTGCLPEELAVVLLSDDSEISTVVKFNNVRGHRNVQLDNHGWQCVPVASASPELEGCVRLMEFESKKLGSWTRCVQQQRCRYYSGSVIVFNTEQQMPDLKLPMFGKIGDQFSVDCHWDIRAVDAPPPVGSSSRSGGSPSSSQATAAAAAAAAAPAGGERGGTPPAGSGKATVLRIYAQVNFASHASSALPRSKIRSSAISELKEWYTAMLPYIQEELHSFVKSHTPPPRTPSQIGRTGTPSQGQIQPSNISAQLPPLPPPSTPKRTLSQRIPDPSVTPPAGAPPPLGYPSSSQRMAMSPGRVVKGSTTPADLSGTGHSNQVRGPVDESKGGMLQMVWGGVKGVGGYLLQLERVDRVVGRGQGLVLLALLLLNLLLVARVGELQGQVQQLAARLPQ